jgi:hypothetical protein
MTIVFIFFLAERKITHIKISHGTAAVIHLMAAVICMGAITPMPSMLIERALPKILGNGSR